MQTCRNQRNPKCSPKLRSLGIQLLVYALLIFSTPPVLSAAVFQITAGDVSGLIAAITAANANGEENTLVLEAGTYTLTAVDNNTIIGTGNFVQANGLPVVTSKLTIRGAGAEVTSIERDENAPGFRILAVTAGGTLTLDGLTIRGGDERVTDGGGGAIASEGTVTITNSTITQNRTGRAAAGGGILNLGTMTIIRSTIASNVADRNDGGGIANGGTMTIQESTIANNSAFNAEAGGISNRGTLLITNSTIADNDGDGVGGIRNSGTLMLTNSTLSRNFFSFGPPAAGGIKVVAGVVTLQNTILALNSGGGGEVFPIDCTGPITSLGNNLIGVNCGIALQPSDLTGDPGLGDFVDDGAPGNGRFPLLSGSQVIDAGSDAACTATDQLGTPRNGRCDIGAVEFYPVVNDLVALANLTTAFDPSPVPGGAAGTFRITAEFTNTSNQAIVNPFVEAVELTGGNLLLNADGGAGGVGARLTTPESATTPFEPGASSTFEFLIGLQQREPFTFFVNMLGDPQTSNPSVSWR